MTHKSKIFQMLIINMMLTEGVMWSLFRGFDTVTCERLMLAY